MNDKQIVPRVSFQNLPFFLLIGAFVLTTLGVVFSAVFRANRVDKIVTPIAAAQSALARSALWFHDQHKHMPPAIGQVGKKHGTIHYHLLPYLEQARIYEENRLDAVTLQFISTSDPSSGGEVYEGKYGTTNYPANWLALTAGPQKDGKITLADSFPDGLSETILFGLRYQMCNGTPTLWGYDKPDTKAPFFGMFNKDQFQSNPSQAECNPEVANTWSSRMNVVMADTSCHTLAKTISPRIWALLLHPADGEKVPANWDN